MSDLQKIRDKRAAIAQQRAALERQDAELAIAEKVLREFANADHASAFGGDVGLPVLARAPSGSRRERVLEALSGETVWMTSKEINFAIAQKYGVYIKGASLFPMLTALKNEGVIVRDGSKMALKSRVDKE